MASVPMKWGWFPTSGIMLQQKSPFSTLNFVQGLTESWQSNH